MKTVLGMGNALVDILVRMKDDQLLADFRLEKGSMTLVNRDTAEALLAAAVLLDVQKSSGGSAANTIHGLSMLGAPVGYIGKIGNDAYGEFFSSYMMQSNICPCLIKSPTETGKSIVLISPDCERTFGTYLGAAVELSPSDLDVRRFQGYDYFLLEGYLVQNHELVSAAVSMARRAGNRIAIDLASFNVVAENLEFLKTIVNDYADIVFANREEAVMFSGKDNPEEALTEIAKQCKIAVVKIGKHGSLVSDHKNTYRIPAGETRLIDTTGAGDLYASGFMYGIINDYPADICGRIGAVSAARIIEVIGAKMNADMWRQTLLMVKHIESGLD